MIERLGWFDVSKESHYIGYAESHDLMHWTVKRGLANPLLSIETTAASGTPESWWAGRSFGPSVTTSHNGRKAVLMFAGYHTASPTADLGDYRQVGQATMEFAGSKRGDEDGDGD